MPGRDMIEESMNHGIRLLYGRDPHDDTTSQLVALANLHNNKIGRRVRAYSTYFTGGFLIQNPFIHRYLAPPNEIFVGTMSRDQTNF